MLFWKFGDLPTFLENCCLFWSNRNSKLKQIFATFYVFTLLNIGLASICYTGLQKALEGPAFLTVVGVWTNSTQIFMLINQDTVNQMLQIFEQFHKLHKEKWAIDMFEKESKIIWKKVHKYGLMLTVYIIFCQTVPLIADSIVGYFSPNFQPIRVALIAQGFIDFVEPRTLTSVLISIPSLLWCYLEILGHVGEQAFIIISIVYIRVELKILKEKILIIQKIFTRREDKYKSITNKLLKDVISHHKIILKGLDFLNRAVGFPVAVANIIMSICLCVNFYGILVFEGKGSMAAKFQGSFACICLAIVLFWTCSLGESLEDENNGIFQSIYDIPWYNENADVKRTVIMMLRQTNKPFFINFHQRAYLNLHTFMQIVNTSYSYFMMLKSTVS